MESISELFNRFFRKETKAYSSRLREKNANKAKIQLMKDAIKDEQKYPSHEKKMIGLAKKQLAPQVAGSFVLSFAIALAIGAYCIKNSRRTKGLLMGVPAAYFAMLVSIDKATDIFFRRRCEEMLERAKKSSERDKSKLLEQARIRIGPDFCLSLTLTFVLLSLIHICRCRRYAVCRSRWSPYH
eukprot:TRINITY_DN2462_c0_g1_i7.p1 TRINITY_DN2462_c0_g1~~TRINITY_DN2462_c0_g1_i7.p1  ORF type:complete len:199 (-),score=42.33 TRINITY_DN2462_c0_g1_i7:24-575(-)